MQKFLPTFTAFVLAAFGAYIAAWYLGAVDGNFALLLFMASVITGVYWVAERLHFEPQRKKAVAALEQSTSERQAKLAAEGIRSDEVDLNQARRQLLAQPWWLDWTAGLFPVIITVFLLRSFVVEPFRIPSGSMMPTLLVGDLILVNKYTYGLRMPVFNNKLSEGAKVQRGDVVVFRYPPQPSLDYIKRVVGLPGDEVAYLNKRLTVNGKPIPVESMTEFRDPEAQRYLPQFLETMESADGTRKHRVLNDDLRPAYIQERGNFANGDNCRYSAQGVVCKVPPGHYFMMGDNRDNSLDSRYWGFVPEGNIVGKAFFVWMNFGQPSRIGSFE
jgi:signal peptidase I